MRVLKKIWNNQTYWMGLGLSLVFLAIFGSALISLLFMVFMLPGWVLFVRTIWFRKKEEE